MNYFAHGFQFLDRPYFLAGTAVPDWLSVSDRKVRLRQRRVEPFADGSGTVEAEIAAGVLQHLHDDGWFHKTRAFFEITGELTRLFREQVGQDDGFRAGFLGHIVTELILDGTLIEENPALLDDYYAALTEIDAERIQSAVNSMATKESTRLATFVPLFRRAEFLRDYLEPDRLLFRLNQVLQRIKLDPLPAHAVDVLTAGWTIVDARKSDLLPAHDFHH